MSEVYALQYKAGNLEFAPGQNLPDWALSMVKKIDPGQMPKDVQLVCRMGDPDLCHCAVFKLQKGGIFSVYDRNGLLFVCQADSNLVFAIAQGFFGEMTANARYGVDVFENMELPDD